MLISIARPAMLIRVWTALILFLSAITGIIAALKNNIMFFITITVFISLMFLFQRQQSGLTSKESNHWDHLSILFFLFITISIFFWAFLFDSGQVSDFGVYFQCGTMPFTTLDQWIANCQSAYLQPNSIYWVRSFFYSSSIGKLFGDNYNTFKIVNAALHIITILIWFLGIRHYYGPRIALVSSALFSFYPEYWFTTTLITPDNAVMLVVVIFILLLPLLNKSLHTIIVISVSLGIVIFLGEQLRSIGLILIISLLAWLLSSISKKTTLYFFSAFFIILGTYTLLINTFNFHFQTDLPNLFTPAKTLSTIDFHTTQDFSVNYLWSEHFWPAIPESMQFSTAIYKIITEFNNGFIQFPLYLYNKATLVFSGSGYYGLSSFNFPPGNPDSSSTISISTIPFNAAFFPWMGAFICLVLFTSTVTALRSLKNGPAFASIIFIGSFFLIVLGAGEAQSRYSILIAPALALLSSLAFFPADLNLKQKSIHVIENNISLQSLAIGSFILLSIYSMVLFGISIAKPIASISERATLLQPSEAKMFGCDNNGVQVQKTYKKIRVVFEGDSTCAVIKVPIENNYDTLSFFVSGSKFPYKFEKKYTSPFWYQLISEEIVLLNDSLNVDSVHWHEVKFHRNNLQSVIYKINRHTTVGKDYLELSFLHSSRRIDLNN